jgi:hypothetical protein
MQTRTTAHAMTAPTSHQRECLPCDLPSFCRNSYFTGKLLTERDFTAEQRYMIDKLRLHHLALHGWGVVCGLRVKPHPYCPDLRIIVEPGLAVDSCGREIRVLQEVELELPRAVPLPLPAYEPCPPEPTPEAPQSQYPPPGPAQDPQDYHQTSPVPQAPEKPTPPEPCPPTISLYICLQYAECETEFMPAPFDECSCTTNSQRPNRICETYKLEVLTTAPPELERIRKMRAACEGGDCEALYKTMLEPCPAPTTLDCIPLAVIANYTPGQRLTEAMIDNWEWRPLLPSTRLLDQLIRCILDKLPAKVLTRITDLGWTHGAEYHCHDFMRLFVGDAYAPKAFEVTFEKPVRAEGLSPLSFQAVVVRHTDKASEGGYLEVVPATVRASPDRTKFYLQIDPAYAERCLHGIAFDLYLTLRCNVIVDERGLPVDGNLLARLQSDGTYLAAPPTGDGMPGGTFESWIRVRP